MKVDAKHKIKVNLDPMNSQVEAKRVNLDLMNSQMEVKKVKTDLMKNQVEKERVNHQAKDKIVNNQTRKMTILT